VGQVAVNPPPQEAGPVDMFTGDEVGNDPSLDISKVQLFFFTIVIVLAYATGLGELFLTDTGLVEGLPELSESILVLLAISHTGYLGYKGISHSEAATSSPRVPNVVGLDVRLAEQAVQSTGLTAASQAVASQEPANQVVDTDPAAGTVLPWGAEVRLYYSEGGS
jgi:hypothetical protein